MTSLKLQTDLNLEYCKWLLETSSHIFRYKVGLETKSILKNITSICCAKLTSYPECHIIDTEHHMLLQHQGFFNFISLKMSMTNTVHQKDCVLNSTENMTVTINKALN